MQSKSKRHSKDWKMPLIKSVKSKTRHYIFGYGSLMNSSSRRNTLPTDTIGIPVLVHGLERTWSYKCNKSKYTAVAVRNGPCVCNGILVELPDPDHYLSLLDEREKEYERKVIQHSRIIPWKQKNSFKDENSIVWVYQLPDSKKSRHIPSCDYPIPQSYIDTIMAGCLNYGQEFTRAFLKLTGGWTKDYLMNDRKRPLKKFTVEKNHIDPMFFDYLIQANVVFE